MTTISTDSPSPASTVPEQPPAARGSRSSARWGERNGVGWLFVAPTLVVLGLFLFIPIVMALWVSFSDWNGRGSPFSTSVDFVGLDNYAQLVTDSGGLTRQDFMTSLRNNFYFVIAVVPAQTALALFLAVVLNQQLLKARGFFRTAFYFPAVTSSVAIGIVFLFLFTGSGVVNKLLSFVGIDGPTWFADARGLLHLLGDAVGIWDSDAPPAALVDTSVLGLSAWQWLSGPSVGMSVIIMLVVWTTTGTFMLMFLAALQDVSAEVEEAAGMDGANRWQSFKAVTLPHLRPTLLLVLTLGIIGTWQVFDQMYVMTQGGPSKTTLTPAYLSYEYAFISQKWGVAAAMAFVLFFIIFCLTSVQRWLFRDKDAIAVKKASKRTRLQVREDSVLAAAGTNVPITGADRDRGLQGGPR